MPVLVIRRVRRTRRLWLLVVVVLLGVGAAGLAGAQEACATTGAAAINVTITEPGAGTEITGAVAVAGRATSLTGVARVELRVDGGIVGATQGGGEFRLAWDPAGRSGPVTLQVVACNPSLGTWGQDEVTVTAVPAQPPTQPPGSEPPGSQPGSQPPGSQPPGSEPPEPSGTRTTAAVPVTEAPDVTEDGEPVAPAPTVAPSDLVTPEHEPLVIGPPATASPAPTVPTADLTDPAALAVLEIEAGGVPDRPLWPVVVAGSGGMLGLAGALLLGRRR
jgi:hypothetical protein